MLALPPGYTIAHTTPSVETYIALRITTGLTPFSTEASARALPNSLFTVLIMHEGEAVGSKFFPIPHPTSPAHATAHTIPPCIFHVFQRVDGSVFVHSALDEGRDARFNPRRRGVR